MEREDAMSATDELKPCPFCGGEAQIKHLITAGVRTHSRVECTRCHVKTDFYVHQFGERNVIKVWNRRTNDRQ